MKTLPLTRGLFAQVSEEDFEAATLAGKWCAHNGERRKEKPPKYYAAKGTGKKRVYLHRFVMERVLGRSIKPGHVVDHHPDPDGLNNRRDNLREITHMENMQKAARWCKKREEPFL